MKQRAVWRIERAKRLPNDAHLIRGDELVERAGSPAWHLEKLLWLTAPFAKDVGDDVPRDAPRDRHDVRFRGKAAGVQPLQQSRDRFLRRVAGIIPIAETADRNDLEPVRQF